MINNQDEFKSNTDSNDIDYFDDIHDYECPICFQSSKYVQFVKLECNHYICISCYGSWHLQLRKPTCCICRNNVNLPIQEIPLTQNNNQNINCSNFLCFCFKFNTFIIISCVSISIFLYSPILFFIITGGIFILLIYKFFN